MFESFASVIVESDNKPKNDAEDLLEKYVRCLTMVFEGDKTINPKDYPKQHSIDIIKSMPTNFIEKVDEFISKTDKLIIKKTIKCNKCGTEHEIEHEGLEDFLD